MDIPELCVVARCASEQSPENLHKVLRDLEIAFGVQPMTACHLSKEKINIIKTKTTNKQTKKNGAENSASKNFKMKKKKKKK